MSKLQSNNPNILNGELFKILESKNKKVIFAQCCYCPDVIRGSRYSMKNFRLHIQVKHPEHRERLRMLRLKRNRSVSVTQEAFKMKSTDIGHNMGIMDTTDRLETANTVNAADITTDVLSTADVVRNNKLIVSSDIVGNADVLDAIDTDIVDTADVADTANTGNNFKVTDKLVSANIIGETDIGDTGKILSGADMEISTNVEAPSDIVHIADVVDNTVLTNYGKYVEVVNDDLEECLQPLDLTLTSKRNIKNNTRTPINIPEAQHNDLLNIGTVLKGIQHELQIKNEIIKKRLNLSLAQFKYMFPDFEYNEMD